MTATKPDADKADAMRCEQAREMMGRYLDGELSVSERIRFRKHINRCRPCRQEFRRGDAVVRLLKAQGAADRVKAPPQLWDAIQHRLEQQPRNDR